MNNLYIKPGMFVICRCNMLFTIKEVWWNE